MTKPITRYMQPVVQNVGWPDGFELKTVSLVESPKGEWVRYDDIKHLLQDEPSEDSEIPMDSRVRHVLQQWQGSVVAIDTKYEILRDDGSHVFAWHRELERLPENRGDKQ